MGRPGRLIAVSIGNTNASLGFFDGRRLRKTLRVRLGDRFPKRSWSAPEAIVIASVNSKANGCICHVLKKRYGIQPLEIGRDLRVPIRNRCRFPEKVGADRLVNALAAGRLVSCPAIVADLGTAITIDAVSSKGDFLGGAILPGARLWTASLQEHTARLPLVDLARPRGIVGKETEEAIRSGVYWGVCGAVGEIVARLRRRLRAPARLVVTGGDADLFSRHLPEDHVNLPDLALQGICMAWHHWRDKGKQRS
ncbi:MAG: type III pantothenate kinase [Planctomycetes bacterium]|nr:type III pantothenate kinase [Planctomycetota bacterium]